ICSAPVTFGGGLTIVNGVASGRAGRNSSRLSHSRAHFASMAAGSKVFSKSGRASCREREYQYVEITRDSVALAKKTRNTLQSCVTRVTLHQYTRVSRAPQ